MNDENESETSPTNVRDRPGEDRGLQGVIPLSVNHMQGVFFIFLFGNLTALIVVFIEWGHNRCVWTRWLENLCVKISVKELTDYFNDE